MTAIKIEKNVPIPKSHQGRRSAYPFASMQLGDSFLVRCRTPRDMNRVRSAAAIYAGKTGAKFKTRSVDGGIRVWLVSREDKQSSTMARAA